MLLQDFINLKSGDQVVYDGKPDIIWTVDHPASCSKKKEWMNSLPIDDSTYEMKEECPGGGGECPKDGRCVRMSTILNNGRGTPRLFQTFFDPTPWTKI